MINSLHPKTHNKVDTQVVWVRLLGLLKGYYSNFILRAIGQAIVPVLKIDENTYSAKRDDLLKKLFVLILGNLRYQKSELMGEFNKMSINFYPMFAFDEAFMGIALICVQRIDPYYQ
ncbi:hypothetical protein J1N35_006294 [Gossypium stocksii]|uniref:DUF4283 domain-containing protein n=1 Tax=Gossypium stocksii TaxID=47602 RepID=A0A9D3WEL3_9ROSI|nr:hypothetical protein J1N35_006294 [Gossypium stocksii]